MTKLELKTLLIQVASEAYSQGRDDTIKICDRINALEYMRGAKVIFMRDIITKYENKEFFKGDLIKEFNLNEY